MPQDGRPVDPATRARVLELFAEGKLGRNAIAREVKLAGSTISAIATQEGHEFDRALSDIALRARQVDLAVLRADLAKAALLEAWNTLDAMHAPAIMTQFEAGHQETEYTEDGTPIRTTYTRGSFREHILDSPTFSDQRNLATVFGIMVQRSADLTKTTNAEGAAEAISFIDGMGATLQLVKERMLADPESDPTVEPTNVSRESILTELDDDPDSP